MYGLIYWMQHQRNEWKATRHRRKPSLINNPQRKTEANNGRFLWLGRFITHNGKICRADMSSSELRSSVLEGEEHLSMDSTTIARRHDIICLQDFRSPIMVNCMGIVCGGLMTCLLIIQFVVRGPMGVWEMIQGGQTCYCSITKMFLFRFFK